MNQKTKKTVGWVLTAIVAGLFTMSAASKLMGAEEAVNGFKAMGISDSGRMAIGAIELLSVILFVIPRTGVLGTVLLIGYMGGTIMAHVSGHLPFISNIAIGVFVGVVGYYRFPELGSRLFGK